MRAPHHPRQHERLKALRALGILDTPREPKYDAIVELVAEICEAPIAVINLIDESRQWFKAEVGLGVRETPLVTSLCAHVILQPGLTIISDTLADGRMCDNPMCIESPNLRFYAGMCLETADGLPIGTLCVLDTRPRDLSLMQRNFLKVVGDQVMNHITVSQRLRESELLRQELRESEIRFRQTFENAAVGVAHVRLDGQWLEVNQTLCDILGYSREELQTKTFQDITHPDDLNADLAYVRRLMAGELQNYGMDKRYIRKDGSRVWCGLTVALRRDATGEPLYFISVVRDISERKAGQEHQEFLLGELAHRMKNQLAIVQAMANQTARNASSLKQFQEKFSERVQGLAVATDVLLTQGWSGAQLCDLIQRQLSPFVPAPDRLECDGPNVTISIDATQTIGLALHELATNAIKHGAWSSTVGRVKVSWQFVTNGATGNNLRVTWVEQDGPVVEAPTRKGFGRVVIEQMAAQRIGGEAKLEFAPKGLRWT